MRGAGIEPALALGVRLLQVNLLPRAASWGILGWTPSHLAGRLVRGDPPPPEGTETVVSFTHGCPTEVEGTDSTSPPERQSTRAGNARRNRLPLTLAVAAVLIVAGVSAYVLTTPPPVPLAISDGSMLGLIRANLTTLDSVYNTLVLYFNATTSANQSDGPTSTLIMQMRTWTYFVGGSAENYYWGHISTTVDITILGRFASNLHPTALQFTIGEIGQQLTGGRTDDVWSPPSSQTGSNITIDQNQELWVGGTGSMTATNPLVAGASGDPLFEFAYGVHVIAEGFVGHNRFVTLRATVEGRFSPAVSVEVGLAIVDVPA